MSSIIGRDIEYFFDSARLVGYFCADGTGSASRPGVVLVHDAYGVSDFMRQKAEQLALLGYAVLAADVWGEGKELTEESARGATSERIAKDRTTWIGRLQEAHKILAAQPGVDSPQIAFVGYCFGGTSALEYRRTVGGIKGAVSFHGGLGRVGSDWSSAPAGGKVLVLTGFDDPRADPTALLELEKRLTAANIDWEVNTYSHTKHGFTRPDSDLAKKPQLGYNQQSDRRSWAAMIRFLEEIFSK